MSNPTSTPSITLYRFDGSCSRVPHILLRELGVPFTDIPMAMDTSSGSGGGLYPKDKSMTPAEYRSQIHPDGKVAALVVDGVVITEMAGVLTYIAALAKRHYDKRWLPTDAVLRAKAYEWIAWLSGTVHGTSFMAFWMPGRFTLGEEEEGALEGIRAKAARDIWGHYERIEARLVAAGGGGDGWAVGGEFSVVDVLVYLFWRWAKHVEGLEEGMVDRWPRFAELARRVEGLEGTRVAMDIEGQGLWFE
jgi:glutathione S-transferase